jgi:hypothetical protein
MAYSIVQYTGNGSQQLFGVTFPFISRDHVSVKVNGVAAAFGWLNDSLVQTTAAPANGATVTISRDSNRSAPIVDFQDAAILTEADLDLANKQAVYVAQEAFDATNVVQVSADVASNAAAAATSASNAAVSAAAASVSQGAALTSAINAAASAAIAATFTPPIAIAYGGTGATTYQGAINALTNVTAAAVGKVLTKVGTDAVWSDPTLPGTVLAILGGDGKFFRGDGVVSDTLNVGTNGLRLSSSLGSGDMVQFFAPSNAVDEKMWAWRMSAPQTLSLYAYNDAISALNYALQIQRSGATISRVAVGGKLLQGDFSNATVANRLAHQTVTANGNTYIGAIPNGSGTEAAWQVYGKSDPTLAQGFGGIRAVQADSIQFNTGNINAGTTLPFKWMVDAAEKMRLDTTGKLGIGCTPAAQLDVNGQFRVVGTFAPASGAGVEVAYNSGLNLGTIIAYDRTGAAYKAMAYDGSSHTIKASGSPVVTVNGTGMSVGSTNIQAALNLGVGGEIQWFNPAEGAQFRCGFTANDNTLKWRYNSGATLMSITNTGFVSINAAASAVMTLAGGVSNDNVQLRFKGNQTAAEQWAIGNMISTGGTGRMFQIFDVNQTAARLSIFDTGNIGIGTTTDTGTQDRMTIFGAAGSGGRVNALTLGNAA